MKIGTLPEIGAPAGDEAVVVDKGGAKRIRLDHLIAAVTEEATSARDLAVAAATNPGVVQVTTDLGLGAGGSFILRAPAAAKTAVDAMNTTVGVAAAINAQTVAFASVADALSNGVIGNSAITPGAGGANGTFLGTVTGGGGSGALFTFVVSGGSVTRIDWLAKGRGYTSAPVLGFAASTGLAGAAATAIIGPNSVTGQVVRVTQVSGYAEDLYLNVGNALTLQSTVASALGSELAAKIRAQKSPQSVRPRPYTTPLVAIYPCDAFFIERRMIPNRAAPTPTRNMMQRPKRFTVNGGIVTYGQPDPWGGNTAIRVQQPAAGNYTTLLSIVTAEAGDYRMRIWAKSSAGAGAQTFTLRKGTGAPTMNLAVTEANWSGAPADLTLTGMVNNDNFTIYNSAGPYPLDIVIAIPEVTAPQIVLPTPPVPAIGAVIGNRLSRPGIVPIDANGNLDTGFLGRMPLTADGVAQRLVNELTMVMTFKQTAADTATFNAPFYSQVAGAVDLVLGVTGTRLRAVMPGLSTALNTSMTAYGDEFLTVALRFGATSSAMFLNGVQVASGTGTGGTPYPIAEAFFGGGGYTDSFPNSCKVHAFMMDAVAYSDSAIMEESLHQRDSCILWGNTMGCRNMAFFEGDSLTAGYNITNGGYALLAAAALMPSMKVINNAVSGSRLGLPTSTNPAELFGRLPNLLKLIRQAKTFGMQPITCVDVGVNEIPPDVYLFNYWKQIRDAGSKLIPFTTSSSKSQTYANQQAFRALILGNSTLYDACVDVGGTPELGANGAYSNLAWYQGDDLHWNNAANVLVANMTTPALNLVRA